MTNLKPRKYVLCSAAGRTLASVIFATVVIFALSAGLVLLPTGCTTTPTPAAAASAGTTTDAGAVSCAAAGNAAPGGNAVAGAGAVAGTNAGGKAGNEVKSCPTPVLRLKPGMRYSVEVIVSSRMILPLPVSPRDQSTMVLDCAVVSVDKAGTARVKATIRSLKGSMDSLGVKASYDSTKARPAKLGQKQRRFWEVFSGLAGRSFAALVDKHGRVLKLVDVDPRLQSAVRGTLEGSFGQDQLGLLLAESNLRDCIAAPLSAVLGATEIKPKATWQDEQTMRVPRAQEVTGQRTYRFAKCNKRDGKEVVVFSYRGVYKGGATGQEKRQAKGWRGRRRGGGLEIVQAGTKGTVVLGQGDGRLVELDEALRAEIRTVQGAAAPRRKGQRQNKVFYAINRKIRAIEAEGN